MSRQLPRLLSNQRKTKSPYLVANSIILTILVGGIVPFTMYLMQSALKEKLRDESTIHLLQMDFLALRFEQFLKLDNKKPTNSPEAFYECCSKSGKLVQQISNTQSLPRNIDLRQLTIASNTLLGPSHFYSAQENVYQVKNYYDANSDTISPNKLAFYKLNDMQDFLRSLHSDYPAQLYFLMTRTGQLIYSNQPDFKQEDAVAQPIAQKFIKSPITNGQFSYHRSGDEFIAFYKVIPNSNLIYFSVKKRQLLFGSLGTSVSKVYAWAAILIGTLFLLVQIPIRTFLSPKSIDASVNINQRLHSFGDDHHRVTKKFEYDSANVKKIL